MKNITLLFAIIFIVLFTSCKKGDEPQPQVQAEEEEGVLYVGNNPTNVYLFKDGTCLNYKYKSIANISYSHSGQISNGNYPSTIRVEVKTWRVGLKAGEGYSYNTHYLVR